MAGKAQQPWANSIVGYGEEAPDQLLAHPGNPKIHPRAQTEKLVGSLNELGWISPVLVSKNSGMLVDGHARVGEAIARGEPSVPVAYVDLTPEQEALALAVYDPIAALAIMDRAQLDALLHETQTSDAALQQLCADLAAEAGLTPPNVDFKEYDESVANEVEYLECPSCAYKWPK